MVIRKENIELFIPHREPFIMVDNLTKISEDEFESDFQIKANNYFVKGDIFKEYGLIENIAQTCAAGLSFMNRKKGLAVVPSNSAVYLAAISKLENVRLPDLGKGITTKVQKIIGFQNMYSFKGECYCEGELLLSCELKLTSA